MAAITDFASLQQAVTDNLARSDLASFAPDFIAMAENWLNYGADAIGPIPAVDPLRVKEMEATTTLTPTAGVAPLPSDYLQYIRVTDVTTQRATLKYLTPDQGQVWYPDGTGGQAEFFSIIGTNLKTWPITSDPVELVYYQAIPALSGSNTTNWLITKAPNLYLRAALVWAAEFIKNKDEMATQGALAASLLGGLNRSNMMGKYARAGITFRGGAPS
ncbi:hypothetical protein EN828_10450 [Mesorhizobium sp. M2D.F.Ca.ET.185.01.1.1]|uniref:phage adaptor protein n=1 Tax=unclassified Mesorhizobium TaxID=325217 RepID=UPI000FCB6A20|nr:MULTISPECIES: hypothetical protein [unclassified Mesorhizobium]TGT97805.1 hypothetical protein EN806_48360 [bacterium M00.F.Ca.ET.163.01.1.1]TGV78709.1 hypothetical protein EN792_044665 [Mesorhizobium sp. M00.F.Ca.ET.149.01.1.1]TGP26090.1 hypothetical protein EN875_034260 [Mesorhizobium sp. M2D.F.Ca.ET.232.01.1.1]TGQ24063.1 hypothetical protein EN863_063855 [Mesorhizobium sp. M00.F.Ca.ET.220.01.1.1]TGQ89456.1 hypothetical protein EN849_09950 [Mesorhizobium sp. M2D.F.Ca.ET.206.01.1.1]